MPTAPKLKKTLTFPPSEKPSKLAKAKPLGEITIRFQNAWDEQQIQDQVVARLTQNFEERRSRKLGEEYDKIISATVVELTEAEVKKVVGDQIKEGWPSYDTYGRTDGKRVSLAEKVAQILERKGRFQPGANYNSAEETWLTYFVRTTIETNIANGMKDEIAAAKKRFNEAVDSVIQSKVAETLKAALGLKS